MDQFILSRKTMKDDEDDDLPFFFFLPAIIIYVICSLMNLYLLNSSLNVFHPLFHPLICANLAHRPIDVVCMCIKYQIESNLSTATRKFVFFVVALHQGFIQGCDTAAAFTATLLGPNHGRHEHG